MVSKVSIGSWITVPHPSIVELMSNMAFSWLCVDLEHSPVSRQDLQLAVSIIQNKGKKAFVRVSENRTNEIKFPLDSGVDGIIIPMVNSADEARNAVSSCLYPPKGKRPVGLARAQQFGFGFESHYERNQNDLTIIVQIEHIDAVQNIDEILDVPEVDGVFLGPYDMSGSMGITGQLTHPRLEEAIRLVAERTMKSGKKLGAHVIKPDAEILNSFIAKGYNFLAFSIDTYFLGQKIQDELHRINH
jgi:2-dehydro-3-deoxyglucarate aldolase